MLADPACNVLVLRAESIGQPRRLLVPLAGGPNATLALDYALKLADLWDGTVTALTIVSTNATPIERTAAERTLREASGGWVDHPRLRLVVEAAPSAMEGILTAANDHDLIMVGASRESVLSQVLFRDIPEKLAAASPKPVIIVKRRVRHMTSWLRRTLDRLSAWMPHITADERTEVYKSMRMQRSAAAPGGCRKRGHEVKRYPRRWTSGGLVGCGKERYRGNIAGRNWRVNACRRRASFHGEERHTEGLWGLSRSAGKIRKE